jgi:hypothetical protein
MIAKQFPARIADLDAVPLFLLLARSYFVRMLLQCSISPAGILVSQTPHTPSLLL